jgi:hypothetical protein
LEELPAGEFFFAQYGVHSIILHRKVDQKATASTGLALGADIPAMRFDD